MQFLGIKPKKNIDFSASVKTRKHSSKHNSINVKLAKIWFDWNV